MVKVKLNCDNLNDICTLSFVSLLIHRSPLSIFSLEIVYKEDKEFQLVITWHYVSLQISIKIL